MKTKNPFIKEIHVKDLLNEDKIIQYINYLIDNDLNNFMSKKTIFDRLDITHRDNIRSTCIDCDCTKNVILLIGKYYNITILCYLKKFKLLNTIQIKPLDDGDSEFLEENPDFSYEIMLKFENIILGIQKEYDLLEKPKYKEIAEKLK